MKNNTNIRCLCGHSERCQYCDGSYNEPEDKDLVIAKLKDQLNDAKEDIAYFKRQLKQTQEVLREYMKKCANHGIQ